MVNMTTFDACAIIEGFADFEPTEENFIEACQFLIDSGDWLKLQGFYGRLCQDMIDSGKCTPPKNDQTDYYGNIVKGTNDN